MSREGNNDSSRDGGYILLPREFVTSLLMLSHEMLASVLHSNLAPREADKLLEKLQATERLYFEAQNKDLV